MRISTYASNRSCNTYLHPCSHAGISVTNDPLNTSEPACITTLSGAAAAVHAIAEARAERAVSLQERIDAETRTA